MAAPTTFRAIVCTKLGATFAEGISNLSLTTKPRIALKPDQVRLRVRASALNFFDLLQLVGQYQYKPPVPFVPGSEAAGDIIETGSEVKNLRVGDAVFVGMAPGNCMAEEMVISERICVRKPAHFTYAQAAGLPVGFFTAYHGLVQRGNLKKGEVLLVTGAAGGMGAAAIQVGKMVGATVIAAASTPEKVAAAIRVGADHGVVYGQEDLKSKVSDITGGNMADVCYEVVGGDIFDQCVRCMAADGRLLVIGFASGKIPKLPINMALIKGFSLVGVRAGAQMALRPELTVEMLAKMAEWTAISSSLAPLVSDEVPSEQFATAFDKLARRGAVGKIAVTWEDGGGATSPRPPQLKSKL